MNPVSYLVSTQPREPSACRLSFRPGSVRILALLFFVALLLTAPFAHRAEASGLPLPRFVSLKSSPANLRVGPGVQYKIGWVFVRSGTPLEIYEEYGNWRRVRDWQGTSGWMYGPLLSGRRTAVTAPWSKENIALRKAPNGDSGVVAWLEPEVPVKLVHCNGQWCKVSVSSMAGFIKQVRLWGAYPGEVL